MCGYQCVFIISVNIGTLDTARLVTLLGSRILGLAESSLLFADLHECMNIHNRQSDQNDKTAAGNGHSQHFANSCQLLLLYNYNRV